LTGFGRENFQIHANQIQLEPERGEILSDAIVQLARELPALGFLYFDEPSREGGELFSRGAQSAFGSFLVGDVQHRPQHARRAAVGVDNHLTKAAQIANRSIGTNEMYNQGVRLGDL